MNGPYETLDETIDRVAARLTEVPVDQTFSARLGARLDRSFPASSSRLLLVSAVVSAAVIVLAVAAFNGRFVWRAQPLTPRIVAAPTVEGGGPEAALAARPEAQPSERATASRSVGGITALAATVAPSRDTLDHVAPIIPELVMPEQLSVDDLSIEALAIDAVGVELLDVPRLEVPAIAGADESKE